MNRNNKSAPASILPLFLKTSLSIAILLLTRLAIINLPMLDEITFPLEFTIVDMFAAAAFTVIAVILVNFGIRLELRVRYYSASFPGFGTVIRQVVFIGAILIIYYFYRPLAIPYLNDLDWIFHLFFLVASLTVLIILGIAVFRSIEDLTLFFANRKSRQEDMRSSSVCPRCKSGIPDYAETCPYCSSYSDRSNRHEQSGQFDTTLQPACPFCGTAVQTEAKFCTACGQNI